MKRKVLIWSFTVCTIVVGLVFAHTEMIKLQNDAGSQFKRELYAEALATAKLPTKFGYSFAQYVSGFVLLNGVGVTRDEAAGKAMLKRASSAPFAFGDSYSASLYWVAKDIETVNKDQAAREFAIQLRREAIEMGFKAPTDR
jgi:hypothetical protein